MLEIGGDWHRFTKPCVPELRSPSGRSIDAEVVQTHLKKAEQRPTSNIQKIQEEDIQEGDRIFFIEKGRIVQGTADEKLGETFMGYAGVLNLVHALACSAVGHSPKKSYSSIVFPDRTVL